MSQSKLIRVNGRLYEEVRNPVTGQFDHVEVSESQGTAEIAGQTVNVRDTNEMNRQHSDNSHLDFLKTTTPQNDKQRLRRAKMLNTMVEEAVLARPKDVTGPNIRKVSDKEWLEQLRYDPQFLPLAKYQHKLTTPSGKVIRPILAGEVGMIGEKIYVLEAGEKFFGGATLINKE